MFLNSLLLFTPQWYLDKLGIFTFPMSDYSMSNKKFGGIITDSPALQYLYEHHLINITADAQGSHGAKATYRWHGDWRSLDQILCSPSLAARKLSSVIGDLPFLLEDDEKYGGKKPYRTYLGPRYLGGYSDHLPLVVQFSSH